MGKQHTTFESSKGVDMNKKENCVYPIWEYKRKGFRIIDRWSCCIGDIENCKDCKKFYHNDWLKSDMESEIK